MKEHEKTVMCMQVVVLLSLGFLALTAGCRATTGPVEGSETVVWIKQPITSFPAGEGMLKDVHIGLRPGGAVVWTLGRLRSGEPRRTASDPEITTDPHLKAEEPKKADPHLEPPL